MEYLTVGKIIDSFGLDGCLKIISTSDFSSIRYKKGNKLYLFNEQDNSRVELTVSSYRNNGNLDFVKFDEISTKEDALDKKGLLIQAIKNIDDLKDGYFYYCDLENCKVYSNDQYLGTVIKVEEFPAQITLRIKKENGTTFFVPFIKQFIQKVDIENKTININLIEGMLWELLYWLYSQKCLMVS